jgi:hypothetical protein
MRDRESPPEEDPTFFEEPVLPFMRARVTTTAALAFLFLTNPGLPSRPGARLRFQTPQVRNVELSS